MNLFRLLTHQIAQWRQDLSSSASKCLLDRTLRKTIEQLKHYRQIARSHLKPKQFLRQALYPPTLRRKSQKRHRPQPSVIFVVAVVSLTSAIGYRLYNEPELGVGTIAPQILRAPISASVVDTKTTEANRKAARTAAVPVLMISEAANQEIYQSLQRLVDRGNELRRMVGVFPFVETSVLSTATQVYLRQAQEWEWRLMLATVEGANPIPTSPPTTPPPSSSATSSQQLAILELQNYRRAYPSEDFSGLREAIERTRQRYNEAIASLATADSGESNQVYNASFFNLSEAEWGETQSAIRLALQRILSQGVVPGLPDTVLESAVRTQLAEVPPDALGLATRILMDVIQPNLVQDPEQTKIRAEQAAQAVEDIVVEIRQGEVIVQGGEIITQSDFVLLDYFGLSRRRTNWVGLLGFGTLVTGSVVLFLWVERQFHPGLRRRDHFLLLLLSLSAPLMVAMNVPVLSLPAIGLLAGSFYGSALGVTTVSLLSLLLPIGMEVTWTNLVASSIGGLIGAAMAGRLRSREELATLGSIVGITQGVIYLILSLLLSTAPAPVWYIVLTSATLHGAMGLAWSVVALGISPYLENLFDLVTPIRLAELSNPNRPLLKRLASEAPGTFQHTLFVATLAEAAAHDLRCNVELVRAGTLYHDIGKMHDPLGFIENQMGRPNKHDAIDDPWTSAAIIKKHVSEGLVMARKCRLPKAIRAFIPEHQGTMLISYFYYQAQQRAKDDPTLSVRESDFRYDGPIPQSRETGIVMLADSCEAALRSLKDATPEEALAMVNRILRARWQDEQLVDSGLSRADMSRIAEIFVQVWLQFNHQRIPYPKGALSSSSSSRGGA